MTSRDNLAIYGRPHDIDQAIRDAEEGNRAAALTLLRTFRDDANIGRITPALVRWVGEGITRILNGDDPLTALRIPNRSGRPVDGLENMIYAAEIAGFVADLRSKGTGYDDSIADAAEHFDCDDRTVEYQIARFKELSSYLTNSGLTYIQES